MDGWCRSRPNPEKKTRYGHVSLGCVQLAARPSIPPKGFLALSPAVDTVAEMLAVKQLMSNLRVNRHTQHTRFTKDALS